MKQIPTDELCKEVFVILILFFYISLEFVNLFKTLKSLHSYTISELGLEKSNTISKVTIGSLKKY